MSRQIKIGLLPFYLELYDKVVPEILPHLNKFLNEIVSQFKRRGINVNCGPVCRVEKDFSSAVSQFERNKVDAIVTLHLAYSPSLESAKVLAKTKLPIVIFDTTPTYSFSPCQKDTEIMFNHGIHGVQDMCNLLNRNGKKFYIEAGHWKKSDVFERVISRLEAITSPRPAIAAANMRKMVTGIIGEPFKGMGDFLVSSKILNKTTGIRTFISSPKEVSGYIPDENDVSVIKEMASDRKRFNVKDVSTVSHLLTTRVSLAVRKWIQKENLSAFTVNFLSFNKKSGLATVPFLEINKSMARGIGYAGEGDVLTASLVGALLSVYSETTFTEMFCPDWENNTIFLSHMGEMNINLTVKKPVLFEKPFPFGDAEKPVVAIGALKKGNAVLINLAPIKNACYNFIVSPVTMMAITGKDSMCGAVRGWFKPEIPISEFLEKYSHAGGTHHLGMVYGVPADEICRFGELMNWNVVQI